MHWRASTRAVWKKTEEEMGFGLMGEIALLAFEDRSLRLSSSFHNPVTTIYIFHVEIPEMTRSER